MTGKIQYLQRRDINTVLWDECMDRATNGLVYGYSFYLDHFSKEWDALVYGDYEYIMPLTWNRKYSFYYLYQPAFTACLGVFGNNPQEQLVQNFVDQIPSKFRVVEISLNHNNHLISSTGIYQRTNFFLNLERTYEQLRSQFRQNVIRNSQKAIQYGCYYELQVEVKEVIRLSQALMQNFPGVDEKDYENFKAVYEILRKKNKAITRGVFSAEHQLVASAVFFFSHGRAYYILVGNDPNGKTMGASHLLIDSFIKEHAGQPLYLDFEGSDIKNLAFFYSSFGAKDEFYQAIKWNRLPWWVKWLK